MTRPSFAKLLSANDIGATGSHQAGICVPKTDPELLKFFPPLDQRQLNPDCWLLCEDDAGEEWHLRYIYYNNRLHKQGTRNEYRITHLTRFFNRNAAREGDSLLFVEVGERGHYRISINRRAGASNGQSADVGSVIRLSGWQRVH